MFFATLRMRTGKQSDILSRAVFGAVFVVLVTAAPAQTPEDTNVLAFTLPEAVEFALKNYPAVHASLERVRAAQAGVGLERTNYLPRADALWQSNRGTDNNITGLLLPQSVIPSLSGAVTQSPSNRSAWGSAAGLLFSWEPFDFGYRGAKVDAARAAQKRAAAEADVTGLDVAVATINTFLTLVAAEQTVRAAQADVDRREIFSKAVRILVENQLRAGADSSRADAEFARARANLARAKQQQEISRATLANLLGIADRRVEAREGSLINIPPQSIAAGSSLAVHPVAEAQHARENEALSQVHVLDHAYYPKFHFQAALSGKGSGLNPSGNFLGGTSGLGLDRENWAGAVTVTFPAFDIFSLRARKSVEQANEKVEAARYDQTIQDLTGQLKKAQASLEGARDVAEATPVELQAARATETQERARYQAGLATLVDVSDAQSLLVQAEIDDDLAQLAVWQNLASVAASQGDIEPFLQFLRDKIPGGK